MASSATHVAEPRADAQHEPELEMLARRVDERPSERRSGGGQPHLAAEELEAEPGTEPDRVEIRVRPEAEQERDVEPRAVDVDPYWRRGPARPRGSAEAPRPIDRAASPSGNVRPSSRMARPVYVSPRFVLALDPDAGAGPGRDTRRDGDLRGFRRAAPSAVAGPVALAPTSAAPATTMSPDRPPPRRTAPGRRTWAGWSSGPLPWQPAQAPARTTAIQRRITV